LLTVNEKDDVTINLPWHVIKYLAVQSYIHKKPMDDIIADALKHRLNQGEFV
jgi:hypothetical protein